MEKSCPARDKKVLNMVQRPARRPFGRARGAFCLEKKTAGTPAAIIFARLPGLQQSARLEEVLEAACQLAAEICQEINWPV